MSEQERCQCADCGAWLKILDVPAGETHRSRHGKIIEGHTNEECLLNQLNKANAVIERLRKIEQLSKAIAESFAKQKGARNSARVIVLVNNLQRLLNTEATNNASIDIS